MPVFLLNEDPEAFPHPSRADTSGLLAVGGDLSPRRLLAAYARGIFPWYNEGQPILWHSPDPRFVLWPRALHVPRSLRRAQRRAPYRIRYDTAFTRVVAACAKVPRPGQRGTWITHPMRAAYEELFRLGYAHCAEAWRGEELAGGLYGVSLGAAFFGESMFALAPDASKLAFVALVEKVAGWGFTLIDCQVETEHLARFGAEHVPRRRYLQALGDALQSPTRAGPWTEREGDP